MSIRKQKNKYGSRAVQIILKARCKYKTISTVGSVEKTFHMLNRHVLVVVNKFRSKRTVGQADMTLALLGQNLY